MSDLRILLLHGPNLSQLGSRDPEQYGTVTLDELVTTAEDEAAAAGASIDHAQFESEGDTIARLHAAMGDGTGAVIVNPGALTHYSYGLRDALEILDVPKLEVHLSNVHAREDFRKRSVVAAACHGSIAGLGAFGYRLAVRAVVDLAAR